MIKRQFVRKVFILLISTVIEKMKTYLSHKRYIPSSAYRWNGFENDKSRFSPYMGVHGKGLKLKSTAQPDVVFTLFNRGFNHLPLQSIL